MLNSGRKYEYFFFKEIIKNEKLILPKLCYKSVGIMHLLT